MGAAGRLLAKHCGNNTTTKLGELGYDTLRRPIKIVHQRNDQPNPTILADFRYDYDLNNNRLSEAKQHYTGRDQAYAYDEVNRLIRFDEGFLVGGVIPNPIDTEVYGLDGVGNRKEHEKNGQLFSNSVDSMNRYAASYNGSLALDYDPRGNTTQYGDLDLTYDVYGKVVGADEPAMTAVYLYDASDRRVMSQVNGYATYFVLEGDRVLQEVDGNSMQVTKEYVWGSAIDELVILQLDGEIYHAHADALGSTALLTDASGAIVERYDYNPFGACVATDVNGGGLVGNPYCFTGRRLDSETGLYYYRARHYTPEMGRFLSPDPIGPWGDETNWGNTYAYGGNNPLSGWDPTGMGWFRDTFNSVRDFGAGLVGGAAESVTFGFVESSTVGNALGADTASVSYKAGSLTGAIGTGIALNVATSGIFGAADATVNVTRGAIQVGVGIANGSTESVLSGLASIGLELLPGAIPSGSSAGRGLANVGDDSGSLDRKTSGSGTNIEPSAASRKSPMEQGPFHRLESPTQTAETARLQEASGEIHGHANRGSDIPSVDAYEGPLPNGSKGVEFTTPTSPDAGIPPGRARWTGPREGVDVVEDLAKIKATITKNTQN